ncbi:MAG: phage tail sheath family protein, partial [Muribaculaceae bacterium]|nr:phage tail sheath family protein [Muribaculaceae bacterium]
TYIETLSTRPVEPPAGYSGIVLFPMLDGNWGPANEWFTIEAKDYNAQKAKLGYDLDYENEHTVRAQQALTYAKELLCYRVGTAGAKAKADAVEMLAPTPAEGEETPAGPFELTATAMYGGTRGNDLRYAIVANPDGGYDVTVYLDGETQERFEGIETVDDLKAAGSEWIVFEGSGNLTAVAGVNLQNGSNGEVTNYDVSQFLDKSEQQHWNTLVFPVDGKSEDDSIKALLKMVTSKIIYLRDQIGLSRRAVLCNYAANHEAIFNVTGGVIYNGMEFDPTITCCWLAGADSAVSKTTSLTCVKYKGASAVLPELSHAEIVTKLKAGEFFFTLDDDNQPVVEQDRNSLTDFDRPRDSSWRKGRVIRTLDALRTDIRRKFPPNKYDNDDTGWDLVEAEGKNLLLEYQTDHALKNVDIDNDFLVDRTKSMDDYCFVNVGACPVDAIEKFYFTIRTR